MRTTIDVPDPLFKRAKARAALRGIKLRALFAEALETYLGANRAEGGEEAYGSRVPTVRTEELAAYADASELQRAYPHGYRITGPLVAGTGESPLTASRVAEAERAMDHEEMEVDASVG